MKEHIIVIAVLFGFYHHCSGSALSVLSDSEIEGIKGGQLSLPGEVPCWGKVEDSELECRRRSIRLCSSLNPQTEANCTGEQWPDECPNGDRTQRVPLKECAKTGNSRTSKCSCQEGAQPCGTPQYKAPCKWYGDRCRYNASEATFNPIDICGGWQCSLSDNTPNCPPDDPGPPES